MNSKEEVKTIRAYANDYKNLVLTILSDNGGDWRSKTDLRTEFFTLESFDSVIQYTLPTDYWIHRLRISTSMNVSAFVARCTDSAFRQRLQLTESIGAVKTIVFFDDRIDFLYAPSLCNLLHGSNVHGIVCLYESIENHRSELDDILVRV